MRPATGKSRFACKAGIIAIGLDGHDGHTRITRGENLLILGGSERTHRLLQGRLLRFCQQLERLGKPLQDVTLSELASMMESLFEADEAGNEAD